MGTPSAEGALSEVITDVIKGKKVSKWVIQLILIFGISAVIRQLFELTGITFSLYISAISVALVLSFISSIYYRNWFEKVINDAFSSALDYDDATELMSLVEDVLGGKKSILDFIRSKRNAWRIIVLAVSNTLFVVFMFLLGDALLSNFLGEGTLVRVGYLGGLLIIVISLTLYIYFEIKPIQDNPEMQDVGQSNVLPLFFKKLYENVAVKKKEHYVNLASIISLFFLIPHLDIQKRSYWLGVYLCTPELRDFILDLCKKENCNVIRHFDNLDDFFMCDRISGLEDLVNFPNLLPMEIYSRFRGQVGKDHPEKMKGLTIKLCRKNSKHIKTQNRDSTYLSMDIIPWKGCAIKRTLQHMGGSRKPEEYPYRVSQAIEDRRIFSIFITGNADSVESFKFQLSLRAPEAKPENINFSTRAQRESRHVH